MKNFVFAIMGAIGSFFAYLFGGWDSVTIALGVFVCIDLLTGVLLAFVFHNSPKTKTGAVESRTLFKGVCRKIVIFLFLAVGRLLDLVLDVDYIRTAVAIAFMAEELISIVENAGLMGIPIPKIITNSIDILKRKGEENQDGG